eukprot:Sspe_Gene.51131::Locus_28405_Transcript_1_1_Confidence_1.000_Length_1276::g.51131::m.51131/K13115/CCDC130; coiled-coil domain-containing protein 130
MPKDIQHSGAFNTGGGGFYRPPEFFDDGHYKKGDIDRYHGQSKMVAQGGYKRLAKMKEGIMLVRFEMPFDVWCDKCGELIYMGVRFGDTEKIRIGKYFSTPLFRFTMRHFCGGQISIENDPKNTTYRVVMGGRRKVNEWDASKDSAIPKYRTKEEREELRSDPIATAANKEEDVRSGKAQAVAIREMQMREEAKKDTLSLHKLLKARHRSTSGLYLHNSERIAKEKAKYGMALVPEAPEDVERAKGVNFKHSKASVASLVGPTGYDTWIPAPVANPTAPPRTPPPEPEAPREEPIPEGDVSVVFCGEEGESNVYSVPAHSTTQQLEALLRAAKGRDYTYTVTPSRDHHEAVKYVVDTAYPTAHAMFTACKLTPAEDTLFLRYTRTPVAPPDLPLPPGRVLKKERKEKKEKKE